jgi:hypothetical protein
MSETRAANGADMHVTLYATQRYLPRHAMADSSAGAAELAPLPA